MKTLFCTIILIWSVVASEAQFRLDKKQYSPDDYVYQPGEPYRPNECAMRSLLHPGAGQFDAGENARGWLFRVPIVILWISDAAILSTGVLLYRFSGIWLYPGLTIGMLSTTALWHIISGIDASRVAMVKNMAHMDTGNSTSLKISPGLQLLPNTRPALSLTLAYRF